MILLLWSLVGCGPEVSYEQEIAPLIASNCLRCHNPRLTEGGLDIETMGRDALVSMPANQSPLPLVEPYDALGSYLFHKVNGTQSLAEGSGTQMPIGDELSPADVELIRLWIDDGARK